MSDPHQKLGRLVSEVIHVLAARAEANNSSISTSFELPTRTGHSAPQSHVLFVIILPGRRAEVLRAVRNTANVAYDWSWNPESLTDNYKLGQFLNGRARDVSASNSAWFGVWEERTPSGQTIDLTFLVVPSSCRDPIMEALKAQGDIVQELM
jgi:hypothetical protein